MSPTVAALALLGAAVQLVAVGVALARVWPADRAQRRFALAAGAAAVVFFAVSPRGAEDFPVSDSVEYAVGAWRLLFEGTFDLPFTTPLPPRYPPWFSLFWGGPGVLLSGIPGGAVLLPMLAGVGCIVFAAAMGARLGGLPGAVGAVGLAFAVPGLGYFGRQILTDVPAALLTAATLALFLTPAPLGRSAAALTGVLVGAHALLRPTGVLAAVPLLFALRRDRVALMLMLLPIAVAAGATGVYNLSTFGSFFRGGYAFWCADPYDSLLRTFNLVFVPENLPILLGDSGVAMLGMLAAGVVLMVRRGVITASAEINRFGVALLLFGGGTLLVYLTYFYGTIRFTIPLAVPLAVLGGTGVGLIIVGRMKLRAQAAVGYGALLLVAGVHLFSRPPAGATRGHLAALDRSVPPTAVLISGLNPAAAGHFLSRGGERTLIPISRRVEYASKQVTPQRGALPPPDAVVTCRGGVESVPALPLTALGDPAAVARLATSGRTLYLDSTLLTPEERHGIEEYFTLTESLPGLYEVTSRR